MVRSKKGTVVVDSRNGLLRIRLPRTLYKDHSQKYISLGIEDTKENIKIAEAKVAIIKADIIYDRFDFSFKKYLFQTAPIVELNLVSIFSEYTKYKRSILKTSSMKKPKFNIN